MKVFNMNKIIALLLYITITHSATWGCAYDDDQEEQIITLKAGKKLGKLPASVANISYFIRNRSSPNPLQRNVISLDFPEQPLCDAFDLEILIPLLKQAKTTLKEKPTSLKGSYLELAQREPLASLNDPEKLLKLYIACDFLHIDFKKDSESSLITPPQYTALCDAVIKNRSHNDPQKKLTSADAVSLLNFATNILLQHNFRHVENIQHDNETDGEAVIKAIALKIARLITSKRTFCDRLNITGFSKRDVLNCITKKLGSHFKITYPYIAAQNFLASKNGGEITRHFSITLRDLLVHEKINSSLENTRLDLYLLHIRSLDGIMDIKNINNITTLNLNDNQLTQLPDDLKLPQLENLYLNNNRFTSWPLTTIAPYLTALKQLSIGYNYISECPKDLKLPTLKRLFIAGNPPAFIIPESIKKPNLHIYR